MELRFLIFGIVAMFGLALAIILFVVRYQRKLLSQEREMEAERSLYQRELLQSVVDAQEVERVRIGRDLHDDIGSMLATVRLYLQQSQQQVAASSDTKWMDKADEVLEETVKNLHTITRDLVPTILNQLGLIEAIEALCDMVQQHSQLSVQFDAEQCPQLPEKLALNLYRIVQELFSNTMKHAEATEIVMSLKAVGHMLELRFQDDGKGIPDADNKHASGLGLKNIESRLSLLEGSFQIKSQPNQGTNYLIRIPYRSASL